MRTSTATSRTDLYSRVTERVIADLEKGVRPWLKPWSAGNGALGGSGYRAGTTACPIAALMSSCCGARRSTRATAPRSG